VSLSCKLCAKSNYFSVTQGTHGPRRGLTQKGRPVFIAPEPITYTDNNLINTTYVVRQSFPLFLASLASLSVQHNSLAPFSSPLFSATSADLAFKVPAYRHRPNFGPLPQQSNSFPVSPHPVNIQHPRTPANPFSSIVCVMTRWTTGG
jgi:hypothetical protein